MDPCLIFGLGSMLASEILWHMLHHRTMPFRIDYGFRVLFGDVSTREPNAAWRRADFILDDAAKTPDRSDTHG